MNPNFRKMSHAHRDTFIPRVRGREKKKSSTKSSIDKVTASYSYGHIVVQFIHTKKHDLFVVYWYGDIFLLIVNVYCINAGIH